VAALDKRSRFEADMAARMTNLEKLADGRKGHLMDPRDVLTVAPGGVAIAASWLNLVETTLSICLLSLSIAFVVYRWWRISRDEK
jgi:hypothetical protein